jgi:hypothetical protein
MLLVIVEDLLTWGRESPAFSSTSVLMLSKSPSHSSAGISAPPFNSLCPPRIEAHGHS